MSAFRRFALWMALSFTFGGFLFYASVVVPTGTRVLGTTTQGFVTRHVTDSLNIAMLGTLTLLVWEIVASRKSRGKRATRILVVCSALIAVCCLTLWVVHWKLETLLAEEEFAVLDGPGFYQLHRVYLWVSTLQWLSSLPVYWVLANAVPWNPDKRHPVTEDI